MFTSPLVKLGDYELHWPDVETVLILPERISEAIRVTHVIDAMDSPVDSSRAGKEFLLGTKGIKYGVERYATTVG